MVNSSRQSAASLSLGDRDPDELIRGMLAEPRDPRWVQDPYAYYEQLRSRASVHESSLGIWIVSRYEDVDTVLHHASLSQATRVATDPRYQASATLQSYANWIVHLDPPLHDVVRGVVGQAFTKRSLQAWRPYVAELVSSLLDQVAQKREFDFIEDFAGRLPVSVICHLLGVPASDHALFDRWARALVATEFALVPDDLLAVADQAVREMEDYLRHMLEYKRGGDQEDLLSLLVRARMDEKITEPQMMGLAELMLVAGADTTTEFLGNGVYALLRNPDQQEKLRAEPTLMSNAVEELMRYDGPAHFSHTKVTTDSALVLASGAVTLPAGTAVMPVLSSANHDPEHFASPHNLDLSRQRIRHFGFTAGVHLCLGANLARMETEIAIGEFLACFRRIELVGEVVWAVHGNLRGVHQLPVAVELA